MVAISRCAVLALGAWAVDGLRARSPASEAEQHKRVIVMQQDKVAFCHVPEAAEQQFVGLFNSVNNIEGAGSDPEPSSLSRMNVQWSDVTRDSGWKFAMFVRHPIERYLRTFLAECVTTTAENHCAGPTIAPSAPLEDKVKLFEERVKSDLANGIADDERWLSQALLAQRHCGIDFEDPKGLDFLGRVLISDALTSGDVADMLHKLTVIPEVAAVALDHFPIPEISQSFEAQGRVPKFKRKATSASEIEEIKAFYKAGTAEDVLKLYQDDAAKYGFHL